MAVEEYEKYMITILFYNHLKFKVLHNSSNTKKISNYFIDKSFIKCYIYCIANAFKINTSSS